MADPHPEAKPEAEAEAAMDLESLVASINDPDPNPADLKCCCGRKDCIFLKHNCSVLDSVEKDVHTAARLGQVRLL